MTPDEKLMIKIYQAASTSGDPHQPVDIRAVGKALGQKDIALKNIVKHLAQANLLKKIDDMTVALTARGSAFVIDMLNL